MQHIQRGAATEAPVSNVWKRTNYLVHRWIGLRDGLHSFDFSPVNRRPLWDAVLLPLMIGGTIAAITGVWLSVRRVRRMV